MNLVFGTAYVLASFFHMTSLASIRLIVLLAMVIRRTLASSQLTLSNCVSYASSQL